MSTFKRFLSLVVALVMVIGMVPATVFATEEEAPVCEHAAYIDGVCAQCGVEQPSEEPAEEAEPEKVCEEGCILAGEEHDECIVEAQCELNEDCILNNGHPGDCDLGEVVVYDNSGTWGGIDWVLSDDGTLTIAPTVKEITKTKPYSKTNPKELYQVGEIPAAVNDAITAITGWPFNRANVKKLVIEEGVTSIGSFALQGLTNLTGEVVIPSTVTYIGQEAFQKSYMTELTFAKGGSEELCIGPGAFKSLAITELVLPEDRSSIHIHCWAFNGCSKLETIVIPSNVDFSSNKYYGWTHAEYEGMDYVYGSYAYSSDIFASCPKIKTAVFGSEEVKTSFFKIQGNKATLDKLGVEYVINPAAKVGGKYYETLQAAIDAAEGQTITVLTDIALTESVTVPAGKTVTLDLNGKTIRQIKACTASYEMINNKGNLTITGNGKISFKDTGAGDPAASWGSYTIRNSGTLVVENGTIENLSEQNKAGQAFAHTALAIFQYSGSTTINGGTISTPNYRSIRLWSGDMTINGGEFQGQVWVHCVDDSAKLTINGGSFGPNGNDGSSVFVNNSSYEAELSVTGGTFETKIGANDAAALAGSITGGNFTEAAKNGTSTALLEKDSKFSGEANAEGYYTIVKKDYVAEVNGEKYESLTEAIAAATAGDTITFLADITEDVSLGKSITLDVNGKKYTGTITLTDKAVTLTAVKDLEVTSGVENYGVTYANGKYQLYVNSGTWGGIDWTLSEDGTLTIAPTKGEPVADKNAPTKRTYEVGEWRETVIYKSNGSASAIGGAPYDMKAVKQLIIEEGVTTIGSFTAQFPNLTGKVVIPSTVTYIGQEAFHKTPITELIFAAGGTEGLCIANGAFKKTLIEKVEFPGDREYIHIHHWAFGGSSNLKTAYIPANVTKSWGGEHVDYFDNFNSQTNVTWKEYGSIFTGCTKMESITFENETVRDLFFANGRQSTADDYIVAYVGLTAYNTVKNAVAAAQDGDTITLLKNNAENLTIDGNVIMDVNGHKYSGTITLTEAEATLTAVEKLKVVTNLENYTVVYEDGTYRVEKAVAKIGETLYVHLDQALQEAKSGDTVELLTSVDMTKERTDGVVIIPSGVTLDIKAFTLTANYIIGLNGSKLSACTMKGSTKDGSGYLKVDKENLVLDEECMVNSNGYGILPVWNAAGWYEFTQARTIHNPNALSHELTVSDDQIKFEFRHQVSSYYKENLLNDGGLDNGVKVIVTLSWEREKSDGKGYTAEQTFVYNETMFKTVNNSSYDYTFALENYKAVGLVDDEVKWVHISAAIVTDCGVTHAIDPIDITALLK